MCVVSMIGEHYAEKWRPFQQFPPGQLSPYHLPPGVTRGEFDALKRAKFYDEAHGEPECEVEEKMALLRKVALLIGVDLDAQIAGERKGAPT